MACTGWVASGIALTHSERGPSLPRLARGSRLVTICGSSSARLIGWAEHQVNTIAGGGRVGVVPRLVHSAEAAGGARTTVMARIRAASVRLIANPPVSSGLLAGGWPPPGRAPGALPLAGSTRPGASRSRLSGVPGAAPRRTGIPAMVAETAGMLVHQRDARRICGRVPHAGPHLGSRLARSDPEAVREGLPLACTGVRVAQALNRHRPSALASSVRRPSS